MNKVICPICKRKFREINRSHLKTHDLTVAQFDEKFPEHPRLTEEARRKKATHKVLTKEMSAKLKRSHTLEGYIEKYGGVEGPKRHAISKEKKSFARTLEGYISRYGKTKGPTIYKEHIKLRAITLENYIKKFGAEVGAAKHKQYLEGRKKYTQLQYYIDKYGEEEGVKVWISKNEKISQGNSKVDGKDVQDYKQYCIRVDKHTRFSLSQNPLKDIDKRGRKKQYHLDHKISKCFGFLNGIASETIGSIHNLEILSVGENCSKQDDCSISLAKLKELIENEEDI